MIKKSQFSNAKPSLLDDTDEEREIELAVYDVLLPCRRFAMAYKVAVLGQVSLTAEFLLRLLKSSDSRNV